MTKTDGRNIGYACCAIIGFVISIISIICWVEYASNFEISEVQCYVNKVDIPQSLPNNTYEHMWEKCNCGKYCKAKTPVADIYVQLNGEGESIRTKYINKEKDNGYTIYDDKCPDGENIVNTINRFDEIQKYKVYLNTTRTCYEDNNGSVYLFYQEYDIILPAILTGILMFVIMCLFIIYCSGDETKKNTPEFLSNI